MGPSARQGNVSGISTTQDLRSLARSLPRSQIRQCAACGFLAGLNRWTSKEHFIGIRTKFGLQFLDMEIHWGLSKTFGTAQALETLGTIPESMSRNINLGTECGNCHKSLNYVKHHAAQKGASGEWLHDDGSPIAVFLSMTTRPARPVRWRFRTMLSLQNCENTIVIRSSSPGKLFSRGLLSF